MKCGMPGGRQVISENLNAGRICRSARGPAQQRNYLLLRHADPQTIGSWRRSATEQETQDDQSTCRLHGAQSGLTTDAQPPPLSLTPDRSDGNRIRTGN